MTATGRGIVKQLKRCTSIWVITEEGQKRELICGDQKLISYVGRAKAWILALLELSASPDLVTISTTLIFLPMPISQRRQVLFNTHGHKRASKWIRITSQKMCWDGEEERDIQIYTHHPQFWPFPCVQIQQNRSLNLLACRDKLVTDEKGW